MIPNPTYDYSGQHVVVTGGARGIGLEIVRRFLEAGANVSFWDFHAENLEEALSAFSVDFEDRISGSLVDVSDPAAVLTATELAWDRQPVDVLVNNAGIAFERAFLDIPAEEWCRVMDINLNGSFHVAQAMGRKMAARKSGVVINMSSKNGIYGEAGYAHYNASKAGVVLLTKTMALELAHLGIRVHAVCPGYIETPMSIALDPPEFTRDFVERYIPMQRPGGVDDVAAAFLFLASDAARFMTGQTLVMDGGQLAGQNPSRELLNRFYPATQIT